MQEKECQKMAYYSIKQVSERTHLPISTLRYYDKEGLTPQIHHTSTGTRQYSEEDICLLEMICCLKRSGMQISDIRKFVELCLSGEGAEEKREILQNQKQWIEQQIEQLKCSLCLIEYKLEHYREIGEFHQCEGNQKE